jgi:hypothetical protein
METSPADTSKRRELTRITRRLCANVWNSPKILKAKHRAYQLQVIYTALNWWELLNYFRFEDPLYILFYTFLGAITVRDSAFSVILNLTWS